MTGFHKRKVERKKKAQENWQERLRQEKIKDRAAIKAERKRQMEQRLADMQAALSGMYIFIYYIRKDMNDINYQYTL